MNQQQKPNEGKLSEQPALLSTMRGPANMPSEPGVSPGDEAFDWVQGVIAALGRYLFAGELTDPMTHRPKIVVHATGDKSILVRYLHHGKPQTVCIGQPLSSKQAREARGFFTDPETNVQKRNKDDHAGAIRTDNGCPE